MSRDPENHYPQRRFFVSGRVQRVGFRYSAYRQANALGLTGYVRNLADGRVEVCAGGPDDKLNQLGEWLHQGPVLARVETVFVSSCYESLAPGFRIR